MMTDAHTYAIIVLTDNGPQNQPIAWRILHKNIESFERALHFAKHETRIFREADARNLQMMAFIIDENTWSFSDNEFNGVLPTRGDGLEFIVCGDNVVPASAEAIAYMKPKAMKPKPKASSKKKKGWTELKNGVMATSQECLRKTENDPAIPGDESHMLKDVLDKPDMPTIEHDPALPYEGRTGFDGKSKEQFTPGIDPSIG